MNKYSKKYLIRFYYCMLAMVIGIGIFVFMLSQEPTFAKVNKYEMDKVFNEWMNVGED